MPATPSPSTFLLKFAALLSLLVIALGITGLFSLSFTNSRTEEMLIQLDRFHAIEVAATETRANFKTQVQEWKNLLLRGSDPDSFERYHLQFNQRSAEVQKQLSELSQLLETLGEDSDRTRALAVEHQKLKQLYTEALTHYDHQNPSSAFKVDEVVRGADRPLSEKIEKLAEDMYRQAQDYHQLAQQSASQRYASLRQAINIVAALAILASFALVFFANRSSRR